MSTTGPDTATPRAARVPTAVALLLMATVWVFGFWLSFSEQRDFAARHGFAIPELMPLIIDGMAISMAASAFAASLDARPAVGARLGTGVAVLVSAASNATWAAERSEVDPITIALSVVPPVAAMIAFEVLLKELRRQVQRRRGDPAPVRIPPPPLARWILDPWHTWVTWRRHVLAVTAPASEPTRTAHADAAEPPVAIPGPATAAATEVVASPDAAVTGHRATSVATEPATATATSDVATSENEPAGHDHTPDSSPRSAGDPTAAPERERDLDETDVLPAVDDENHDRDRVIAELAEWLRTADNPAAINGTAVCAVYPGLSDRTARRWLATAKTRAEQRPTQPAQLAATSTAR